MLVGTLTAILMFVAGIAGFVAAKGFVSRRLRFVDAIRSPLAPVVAAGGAFLLAWPVAALLPLVTTVTAAIFSAGVGFGTASGVRAVASAEGSSRYLP